MTQDLLVPDTSRPHIVCHLADSAPLVDGCIPTAELNAILWLACLNGSKPVYGKPGYIGVSSVTGA